MKPLSEKQLKTLEVYVSKMDASTGLVVMARVTEVEGTLSPAGLSTLLKHENIEALKTAAQCRLYAQKIKLNDLSLDDIIHKYELEASGYSESINPMTGIVALTPCSVKERQLARKAVSELRGHTGKDKVIRVEHTLATFLNRVSSQPFGLPNKQRQTLNALPIDIEPANVPIVAEAVEPAVEVVSEVIEPESADGSRLPPPRVLRRESGDR